MSYPLTFLPSSTPIQHIYCSSSGTDSHGNPTITYGDPVDEACICWWPLERRTWEIDPISPDTVARYENDVHMLVADGSNYTKGDRVIIENRVYTVEGLPTDWSSALPFPAASYGMLVGAEIHLRRVTSTGVLAGGSSTQ